MQIEDPDFLTQSHQLINFYREYPEIAAEDLLNIELADIQKVVLRAMWNKNYVMAIMCRGAGKTFINGVFACLKCMLYPGHRVGLLAPTFRQSKFMFDECDKLWKLSPIFQDATIKKPTHQSDNCYIEFKSVAGKPGSKIQAVPLGDGTKIRGSRFFSIICDEFPHIPPDIFNMVIRPMAATVADPMENVKRVKREKELTEAGLLSESDFQSAQVANQILITSSGYFTFNHMYELYSVYKKEMLSGNEKYAVFRIPHTLIPEGFLDVDNITSARKEMSSLEFSMEYEAAFIPDTDGFYKASLLEACKDKDHSPQVAGTVGKSYILGVDPARSEDSFAIVIAEVSNPARIVHALEYQKETFPKMASVLEDLCLSFNVQSIYMDAGGGGLAIKDILAENHRSLPGGPILDPEEPAHQQRTGRHILTMCNFGTEFISDSNFAALRLLEHGEILFPSPPKTTGDEYRAGEDEAWTTITRMLQQMQTIVISETPTGKIHFDVPKGQGHGVHKKDLYTAFMLAARGIYDFLWAETIPDDEILHTGIIQSRRPAPDPTAPALPGGLQRLHEIEENIPEVLRDKLELIQDPELFKQKMMDRIQGRARRVLTSPSAVLTPKMKPKR
jgi:hypothetical protein